MDHVKFYYARLIGHVRLKYFTLACVNITGNFINSISNARLGTKFQFGAVDSNSLGLD